MRCGFQSGYGCAFMSPRPSQIEIGGSIAMPTRRRVLAGLGGFGVAAAMLCRSAWSEELLQHPVLRERAPIRIAIPAFVPGGAADDAIATGVTQIVTDKLRSSGRFLPLDPSTFIDRITGIDVLPRFAAWKQVNAEALIAGRAARLSDGRLMIEFRLWDPVSGAQLEGQQYIASPDDWRQVAHIIADTIISRMSGQKD